MVCMVQPCSHIVLSLQMGLCTLASDFLCSLFRQYASSQSLKICSAMSIGMTTALREFASTVISGSLSLKMTFSSLKKILILGSIDFCIFFLSKYSVLFWEAKKIPCFYFICYMEVVDKACFMWLKQFVSWLLASFNETEQCVLLYSKAVVGRRQFQILIQLFPYQWSKLCITSSHSSEDICILLIFIATFLCSQRNKAFFPPLLLFQRQNMYKVGFPVYSTVVSFTIFH